MPVRYRLNSESGSIHTRCVGDVTLEDVMGHFDELRRDPALPRRLDVLLDLGEMQSIPERDQLWSVAGALDGLASELEWGVCAIVASSDALFGMIRVFMVFAEEVFVRTQVFRTLAEAEAWLASQRAGDP